MRSKHARRVLLAAPLFLTFTAIALAETPDIPPLPAPTVAPATAERIEPKATILFPGAAPLKVRSKGGSFPLTAIRPREVVEIKLEFPGASAGTPLIIQAPDGGEVLGAPKGVVTGAEGTATFRFQVSDQPGAYRLSIRGAGSSAMLKFWISDPQNPKANPPVINPQR
jgi:hypothetical protein